MHLIVTYQIKDFDEKNIFFDFVHITSISQCVRNFVMLHFLTEVSHQILCFDKENEYLRCFKKELESYRSFELMTEQYSE